MSIGQVNPGDVVLGKYRIDQVVGRGNMGMIVAATHIELGQRVAIKLMLPGSAPQKEQHERFLREARASVHLKSQHVARVFDVGTDNGAPYMVMEYLHGKDLAALLLERGPLPIAEAVDYVLQACEAVGEAHRLGIVHRDLKPANMFLTSNADGSPLVKVIDFGISKLTGSEQQLTHTSALLGSPLYMAPEQIKSSKDVDARADIWSLGVILFELLAGKPPFTAQHVQQLFAKVFFEEPTKLETYRSDAPAGLGAVIAQCLQREPSRRWGDVAAFAAAVAPYGSAAPASYAARVASVLNADIVPSRLTDLLPVAPEEKEAEPAATAPAEAGTGSALVQPAAPVAEPKRRGGMTVAIVALGLAVMALATVEVVRWRVAAPAAASVREPPASAVPVDPVPSAPVGSVAGVQAPTAPAPEVTTTAAPSATTPASTAKPAVTAIPRILPAKPAPTTVSKPPAPQPRKDLYAE